MKEIKLSPESLDTDGVLHDSKNTSARNLNLDENDSNKAKKNENDNFGKKKMPISDIYGYYSYGDVAKLLEIAPHNLRYYVDLYKEYIKPKRTGDDEESGNWRFSDEGVEVLQTIFLCKENGMRKPQIMDVLKGNAPAPFSPNDESSKAMFLLAERLANTLKNEFSNQFREVVERQTALLEDKNRAMYDMTSFIEEQTKQFKEIMLKQEDQLSSIKEIVENQQELISSLMEENATIIEQNKQLSESQIDESPRKKGFLDRLLGR